jgi:hypothetical protein
MLRQKRIRGGRMPLWGSLDPKLQALIEREARRFDVSVAFVVSTALGDYFRYALDETYMDAYRKVHPRRRYPRTEHVDGSVVPFERRVNA